MIAAGTLIPASTVVKFYVNDKPAIKATIGELIDQGQITGGNPFNL